MKRSILVVIGAILILTLIVGGCSQPTAPTATTTVPPTTTTITTPLTPQQAYEQSKANFEKIIAAAKKEGALQIYGGFEPGQQDVILKLWNQKYPEIKVDVLEGRQELQARIEAEIASGQATVDMTQGPSPTNWVEKAKGFFQPIFKENLLPNLTDPSAKWFEKPIIDPEGYYLQGTWGSLWGIAVNTKLVPADKIPKSWADLTDPYWKGKVYMGHPAGDSIGGKWYYFTRDDPNLGKAFHEKLAQNGFTVYMGGSSSALKACATGEYAVQFPAGSHAIAELTADIPVTFVFPKEGTISQLNNYGIVKNAPHPNAALVFVDFLLSKEGMTALGSYGRYVARADAVYPYPKFQTITPDMKLYQWPSEQEYLKTIDSHYAEARQIYNVK